MGIKRKQRRKNIFKRGLDRLRKVTLPGLGKRLRNIAKAARRRIADLTRDIKRLRRRQREDKPGEGPWAGTQSIVEQEVIPIMRKYGPITSTKRSESFGNPTSDHHTSQTNAYAADCGITNRHDVLDEIARKVVGRNVADYENVYFTRAGKRFRFQGIAGTHGTGPHLHVGIRRA